MSVPLEHPNEDCHRHPERDTLREFWLHGPTGYVWALEIDSSGRVIAAAGPLASETPSRCYCTISRTSAPMCPGSRATTWSSRDSTETADGRPCATHRRRRS